MGFRRFAASDVQDDYLRLYKKAQRLVLPFCGFDYFNKKLFAGDFLLLQRRYDMRVYGWYLAGQPKILVTHYLSKDTEQESNSSIGAILIDPSTAPSEIICFQRCLKEELKQWRGKTIAPLNGHKSLGFALPSKEVRGEDIGYQSSSQSSLLQSFFSEGTAFRVSQQLHSSIETIESSKVDSASPLLPKFLSIRPISQLRFKRDITIYNQLLN
ncbi:hypothetical protein COB52_05040, partial [Candidatus Kaiserbacteria bacterium]